MQRQLPVLHSTARVRVALAGWDTACRLRVRTSVGGEGDASVRASKGWERWCWHSGVPCLLRRPWRRRSRPRAAASPRPMSRPSLRRSEAAAFHPAQRGARGSLGGGGSARVGAATQAQGQTEVRHQVCARRRGGGKLIDLRRRSVGGTVFAEPRALSAAAAALRFASSSSCITSNGAPFMAAWCSGRFLP